jgi:anti-sigma factor RsiW
MKESKFVELLNLYIDQEISPAEAELLEEEIQRDPARRRVYLQYCRMHRASAVLFESFRSESMPAGGQLAEAARAAAEKVVAFPPLSPRRSSRWVYAAGLVAAAACVAFVLVRRSAVDHTRPNDGTLVTQAVTAPARSVTAPPAAVTPETFIPAVAPMTRREFTPVFVARSLTPPETPNAAALLAANRITLEWMQRIQLSPVQNPALENLVFETQPTLQQDQRTYRSSLPVQGNVDKVSFEFQR